MCAWSGNWLLQPWDLVWSAALHGLQMSNERVARGLDGGVECVSIGRVQATTPDLKRQKSDRKLTEGASRKPEEAGEDIPLHQQHAIGRTVQSGGAISARDAGSLASRVLLVSVGMGG